MPTITLHRRLTGAFLIVVSLLLASVSPIEAIRIQDVPAPGEQLEPVTQDSRDDLQDVLADVAAIYTIDAEVELPDSDSASPQLAGALSLEYTNTTTDALNEIPFRLYANGPDPEGDALEVASVLVDGKPATTRLSADVSTLWVELGSPLVPDQTTIVAMEFVATVPVDARDHFGIFNVDPDRGTWALAHWYPILAGRDPDRGWVLDAPSENGDPIFSDTAAYALTLRTPAEWRVVSTGIEVGAEQENSVTERRIVTGPARDLTLVLDNDFESAQASIGGTNITSWYNPGDERVGNAVLDYAAQSLTYFNELIGPYPFITLDLVPVELFGAAGVEFPQLLYIGASYYSPDQTLDNPNSLDFTVAHEVLHQWWYSMVGNNQYDDAFIDEGLTNFMSSTLYFTEMYGPEAGAFMTDRYLEGPFRSNVASGNDPVVDTPTDEFASSGAYVFAAYSKAPLGFKAIFDEIGADAFTEAVQTYYLEHRFSVATPDDLLNAFEAASGRELDELWSHWFEESAGEDDL
jgi:hypothetical protein